jgi:hypothetical protein
MKSSTDMQSRAMELQQQLETKVLNKKGVSGTSVSTMPGNHSVICVKVIVTDASITNKTLGIETMYNGIPVIISHEHNQPL